MEDIDLYVGEGKADGIIMEPGQFFLRGSMPADDKMLWPIQITLFETFKRWS